MKEGDTLTLRGVETAKFTVRVLVWVMAKSNKECSITGSQHDSFQLYESILTMLKMNLSYHIISFLLNELKCYKK